jgi:hypothetical protein
MNSYLTDNYKAATLSLLPNVTLISFSTIFAYSSSLMHEFRETYSKNKKTKKSLGMVFEIVCHLRDRHMEDVFTFGCFKQLCIPQGPVTYMLQLRSSQVGAIHTLYLYSAMSEGILPTSS